MASFVLNLFTPGRFQTAVRVALSGPDEPKMFGDGDRGLANTQIVNRNNCFKYALKLSMKFSKIRQKFATKTCYQPIPS